MLVFLLFYLRCSISVLGLVVVVVFGRQASVYIVSILKFFFMKGTSAMYDIVWCNFIIITDSGLALSSLNKIAATLI